MATPTIEIRFAYPTLTNMQEEVLARAIRAVLKPPADARGLPNQSYTDPALFAFEREHVLGSSWAALCFESDLPGAGFAYPVQFMGLPLLVIRNKADALQVFHNVCQHRGMTLVETATPLRQLIRCPYHSWAYDLDGQLKSTPHVGGTDQHQCKSFDSTGISLQKIRTATWLGIVFINLDGNAEPFEAFLEPLLNRWKAFIPDDSYQHLKPTPNGGRLDINVKCNWKLAVENYCEAYHLPWVHPALNSYSPLSEHYNILIDEVMSGQGSRNYKLATVSAEQLPTLPGWPQDRLHHAEYISLYPNVLLGIQADHVFAMIVLPVNEQQSLERLELSFVGTGATDDRFEACRNTVMQSWNVVFGEDIFAVEGMQTGRVSPGFDGGLFTPVQDLPTHHFHQWVARRYLSKSVADD